MIEHDPSALTTAERYKLLIGCITPRPIAFVSTISTDGVANLAPFSFFAGVGSDPMMVLFCPANDAEGKEKDSLRNAKLESEGGVGHFVVNLATEAYAAKVAGAAEPLPEHESEFALVGLTPAESRVVSAPRVEESPASFECVTTQVIRTNPGVPAGGNIVLGRVVNIWIREDLVNERMHVDQKAIGTIGRMGGSVYCRTGDQFEMPMGKAALEAGSDRANA